MGQEFWSREKGWEKGFHEKGELCLEVEELSWTKMYVNKHVYADISENRRPA